MANTSSRTLRLLSLLQTQRYWPGASLAERLEVSPRTLRRDIDRLRELGYPVTAQTGIDGGYQLAAGAALPPLVLDDDEAVALAVGLLNAANSAVAGTAESSVRALAKVVHVMPRRLRRQVDAVWAMTEPIMFDARRAAGASVDSELLTTVAQACRDTVRLEFDYTTAAGTQAHRRSEPHRLVSQGRRWYLVAYDLDRQDWRSFRLDRMAQASATSSVFAPRRLPASDAAEFVRSGLQNAPRAYAITATVQASVEHVRARIGQWSTVVETDSPGNDLAQCSVTMQTESLPWAAIALGLVEADFTVLHPPEFAQYLHGWATRFAQA